MNNFCVWIHILLISFYLTREVPISHGNLHYKKQSRQRNVFFFSIIYALSKVAIKVFQSKVYFDQCHAVLFCRRVKVSCFLPIFRLLRCGAPSFFSTIMLYHSLCELTCFSHNNNIYPGNLLTLMTLVVFSEAVFTTKLGWSHYIGLQTLTVSFISNFLTNVLSLETIYCPALQTSLKRFSFRICGLTLFNDVYY